MASLRRRWCIGAARTSSICSSRRPSTTGHVAAKAETVQGFSLQRWSDQGMRFIAISDLGADELKEFHTQV